MNDDNVKFLNTRGYNLEPVWMAILGIYQSIADICNRHSLTFYFTSGNLLGAVRHGGFIPWDDDLDIFMPWDDYDKFWVYAEKELPQYWKSVGWWNTPEYPSVFGKVQETRRDVVARIEAESGLQLPHGIYVDVFPLVNEPTSFFGKIRWQLERVFIKLKTSAVFNKERRTVASKIVGRFRWCLFWLYPSMKNLQSAMAIHERRARRYSSEYNGTCGWYEPNRLGVVVPIPTKYFGKPQLIPFCDILVPAPHDYKGYLRCKYGDYMALPPEEYRHPTHAHHDEAPWKYGPTGTDVRNKCKMEVVCS